MDGGLELFIIGKNFLKDTHVVFQETYDSVNAEDPATEIAVRQQLIGGTAALWEQSVLPDKEYLHQVWTLIYLLYTYIKFIFIFLFGTDTFDLHSASVSASKSSQAGHRPGVDHLKRKEEWATQLYLHT